MTNNENESSLTVPLLYKRWLNRQITIAVLFSVLVISISVLPIVPNLIVFYGCAFATGFCSSVVSCGYPVWQLEIWKSMSGPILQISEFGFGIGSIVATVILKPFLVGERTIDSEVSPTEDVSHLLSEFANQNSEDIDRKANLMWPSLITGAVILPIPICSLIMYFIKPYKPPELVSKGRDENSNNEEIKLFDREDSPRITFRVLCCMWYTAYVIFESMYLKYAVTYLQYCPQQLTAQKAAEIFSIATAVFTAFRGINFFIQIGFKLKMISIIYYHYVILIIAIILLVIGQHYMIVMWSANIVLCWGFSSMFAGIYSYTGDHLTMTNQLSTIFVLVRGLFTLVTPYILGLYIEEHSEVFIIIEAFYLGLSLVFFAIIMYYIKKYSKLLKQKTNEN